MKSYILYRKRYQLSAISYQLIFVLFVILIAGCGTQYSAEKLYWQAEQTTKAIIQNRPLDKLATEDYQKIIAVYRRVVERYPLEPLAAQSQFIIAQLYVSQGQYSQAQKELLAITRNFAASSEIASRAQFIIGNLYQRQGNWEMAVSEYKKLIDLYPLSNLGLKTPIYIAQYYQRTQENSEIEKAYKAAERNYRKLINTYSDTSFAPVVMDYLAVAYSIQGRWDEAMEIWQAIAGEYSNSSLAAKSLLACGEIYTKQIKDMNKAIEVYDDFADKYPRSQVIKQVKFRTGRLYLNKGDTEKAKQIFLGIVEDYPKEAQLCANARFALAACYEKEKDGRAAIEEYQRLREDYPDTKLALAVPFFIARYYLINQTDTDKDKAQDAFTRAIVEYEKIIEQERDVSLIIEAGRLLGLCYIQQQNWDKAISSFYNMVTRYPDNPQAQMFLFDIAGIYQQKLNKPQKATQIYKGLVEEYSTGELLHNFAEHKLAELEKSNKE